jgi:hypothetical protein
MTKIKILALSAVLPDWPCPHFRKTTTTPLSRGLQMNDADQMSASDGVCRTKDCISYCCTMAARDAIY